MLVNILEGIIKRIIYRNEENGYTVARLIPKGKDNHGSRIKQAGFRVGADPSARLSDSFNPCKGISR